ncbi:MAG: hypothetical protein IT446_11230 [Phycisphaerales bacterium]|jgi:hypothetical protein|nr:hypothetical protein [Phycisphaerales bacterium]
MHTIHAKQFVDAEGGIVASAARLADQVVVQLKIHEFVEVDLSQLRGLPSSYFNVLLQRVIAEITLPEFTRRVRMRFDTPAQELMFNRSLEFARRTVA